MENTEQPGQRPQRTARERVSRVVRWLLKAGISAGLIYLLLSSTNFGKLADRVASISLGWFLIATLIKGTGILAGVIRWRLLLGAQDLRLRTLDLGGAYLIGRFFGSFLPSTLGLDGYRTYYAAVRTGETAKVVAVTAVEKVLGLLALSSIALLAIPMGMGMLPEKYLLLLGLALCVPIAVAVALLAWPQLFQRIAARLRQRGGKITSLLAKMSEAVARFGEARRTIVLSLLLGLVVHGATSAMYLATARAVGADIDGASLFFIGPLMIAATLVPLSIAGIGVREGTYVYFLSQIGVPTDQAVLLAFLGFMAGEVYSLAGGAVWALRPASRPEEGTGLLDVVRRAAAWAGGRGDRTPSPAGR